MADKEMERWADRAMYESEAMPQGAAVGPRVYLLQMTADPLGAIAAATLMYKGKVVRSLSDVTHEERVDCLAQIMRTHLKAPFEFVDFHFMIEGVSRSFTHQMVRQRTAVYAQESLRFAVKENLDSETPLPPSLAGRPHDDPLVVVWRAAVNRTQDSYEALVSSGVPAEDARGLLPHATTTRLHYKTNLRGLLEHLGNRLCTQAQFEWKSVAVGMVEAIRDYRPNAARLKSIVDNMGGAFVAATEHVDASDAWQQEALADIFRPVCYLTGKCEFNSSFDRACSIRDRVTAFHENGIPSSEWDMAYATHRLLPIHPAEWLADHTAAREA